MEKFTASNGSEVEAIDHGRLRVTDNAPDQTIWNAHTISHTSYLDRNQVDALREFFIAERDEKLGRWRDPEGTGWVAYPITDNPNRAVFFNENTAQRFEAERTDGIHFYPGVPAEDTYVANRYFAAHPELKPWHDAKPGEVWVLNTQYGELPLHVLPDGDFDNPDYFFEKDDKSITAGRRIFPEASDE